LTSPSPGPTDHRATPIQQRHPPAIYPEPKVGRSAYSTRQVRAAMPAQRNKTDATDALGLAHLMRTGWFRQAHVRTDGAHLAWLNLVM
jgi:hypothetical protein